MSPGSPANIHGVRTTKVPVRRIRSFCVDIWYYSCCRAVGKYKTFVTSVRNAVIMPSPTIAAYFTVWLHHSFQGGLKDSSTPCNLNFDRRALCHELQYKPGRYTAYVPQRRYESAMFECFPHIFWTPVYTFLSYTW